MKVADYTEKATAGIPYGLGHLLDLSRLVDCFSVPVPEQPPIKSRLLGGAINLAAVEHGCELIATYNALKYIGLWTGIRDIAYYCEWNGSALYGLLGTNPNGIKKYLDEEKGLNTVMYMSNSSSSYGSALSSGRVAILTF